jgi:hypothetical protein
MSAEHTRFVPKDTYYAGNLGFGADGDICMHKAIDQHAVSEPCARSVAALDQLRAQYWEESQVGHGPPHGHFVGALLVLAVVAGCFWRRFRQQKYHRSVQSLLSALEARPDLKTAVENSTGLAVPQPMPVSNGCCSPAVLSSQATTPGIWCRIGKVLLLFALVVVVSFLVMVTSLEVTMRIISHLNATNTATGSEDDAESAGGASSEVTPFVALSILFMVCTAELALVVVVSKAIRKFFCRGGRGTGGAGGGLPPARNQRHRFQGSVGPVVEGAPITHFPVPSAPVESTPNSGTTSAGFAATARQYIASLPSNLFVRRAARGTGDGYTALLADDDLDGTLHPQSRAAHGFHGSSTEMTTMGSYPATRPSQQPITARPVNAYNMNLI